MAANDGAGRLSRSGQSSDRPNWIVGQSLRSLGIEPISREVSPLKDVDVQLDRVLVEAASLLPGVAKVANGHRGATAGCGPTLNF